MIEIWDCRLIRSVEKGTLTNYNVFIAEYKVKVDLRRTIYSSIL